MSGEFRRILVVTMVDEVSGDNHQVILDELLTDSSDDAILAAVNEVRSETPRLPSNIIPFPIPDNEES
jgi:hypothetical protein|tara:strand:+ start:27969 stop:28172 length:204 start_codon:yes stop_codon:yes gene_type:complete